MSKLLNGQASLKWWADKTPPYAILPKTKPPPKILVYSIISKNTRKNIYIHFYNTKRNIIILFFSVY